MAHYIDKDALIAEIEKIQKKLNIDDIGGRSVMAWSEVFKNFINTIEVKEADLEKEIKEEYLKWRWYSGKNNMLVILSESQFNKIAKHFYELGLKAQKGE